MQLKERGMHTGIKLLMKKQTTATNNLLNFIFCCILTVAAHHVNVGLQDSICSFIHFSSTTNHVTPDLADCDYHHDCTSSLHWILLLRAQQIPTEHIKGVLLKRASLKGASF
jgi:hypothetical protein